MSTTEGETAPQTGIQQVADSRPTMFPPSAGLFELWRDPRHVEFATHFNKIGDTWFKWLRNIATQAALYVIAETSGSTLVKLAYWTGQLLMFGYFYSCCYQFELRTRFRSKVGRAILCAIPAGIAFGMLHAGILRIEKAIRENASRLQIKSAPAEQSPIAASKEVAVPQVERDENDRNFPSESPAVRKGNLHSARQWGRIIKVSPYRSSSREAE